MNTSKTAVLQIASSVNFTMSVWSRSFPMQARAPAAENCTNRTQETSYKTKDATGLAYVC